MKKRIISAVTVFLLSALIILPVLARDTHALLLQDRCLITWNPVLGWDMVFQDPRVRQFYFLYTAGILAWLIWALVSGNYIKYRSNMQTITPDIVTPCADGQGQFGTARWLPKEHIGRFFFVWKIPGRQYWLRDLLKAGKADAEEVKHAKDIKLS